MTRQAPCRQHDCGQPYRRFSIRILLLGMFLALPCMGCQAIGARRAKIERARVSDERCDESFPRTQPVYHETQWRILSESL